MVDKKDNSPSGSFDHLNEEDRALWQLVSDTTEPLIQRPERPKRKPNTKSKKPAVSSFRNHKKPVTRTAATAPSFMPMATSLPVFAPNPGVDKRLKRKLGRGQMDIDARLDLHGKTRAQAHRILKSFIVNAQTRGHRNVLVITGKGGEGLARHTLHSHEVIHAPERTGILMREVPQWLNEPEFAGFVVGYQPAHPKHGGGGALYIRIRRLR